MAHKSKKKALNRLRSDDKAVKGLGGRRVRPIIKGDSFLKIPNRMREELRDSDLVKFLYVQEEEFGVFLRALNLRRDGGIISILSRHKPSPLTAEGRVELSLYKLVELYNLRGSSTLYSELSDKARGVVGKYPNKNINLDLVFCRKSPIGLASQEFGYSENCVTKYGN